MPPWLALGMGLFKYKSGGLLRDVDYFTLFLIVIVYIFQILIIVINMKSIAILSSLAVLASANPHHGEGDWMPPGHDDCMFSFLNIDVVNINKTQFEGRTASFVSFEVSWS